MKRIVVCSILILLALLISSYRPTWRMFGCYADSVCRVKQEYDTWCFYAVCSMERCGSNQCSFAQEYQVWQGNTEVLGVPPQCCDSWEVVFCVPPYFKDIIPFYNYSFGTNYRRWNTISNFVKLDTDQRRGDAYFPRLGLLDLRSSGGSYHAVYLYRVDIDAPVVAAHYTYEESYIDPWTGDLESKINYSSSPNWYSSQVYILE